MSEPVNYSSLPPTPLMGAVGLDWSGVQTFAAKAVKLLQEQGDTFLDLIDAGFKAFKAVTGRDFVGIFTELNRVTVDVQKLIDAIRAEFSLGE